MPSVVDEPDLGNEEDGDFAADVPNGMMVPFPHECHHLLIQEMLNVFRCEILVDASPGSGVRLLGVLLSNCRAVAICRNATHAKFVKSNLTAWVKARKLVPGFKALPKPSELLAFENKNQGKPVPAPAPAAVPTPSPAQEPATAVIVTGGGGPSATSSGGASQGLKAFGSVML
jgi:hypothetical protein